ncbi:2-oxo acid dehydrogenase subunit E2 [Nocardia uniformis]|uniref:Dihydrolipoamide acetyltransferase component of pyruvate dehydrogenase complex n=1 Tax=Nocardia uniformis TaxID=53432 RepID=A0A849BUN0_9NOCA|nr:dihydrolipoamide acetyltransferase family protein [Nocardia uniformis]NNH70313.1 2-oxo acid dehydrogenase subunit E2 [Nocardia uniformis]
MEDQQHVLEFRLPDLGEGLADAELVSWAVEVGDQVELNQTIAEVETAKAQVALPCPFAGKVLELLARPGDTVPVGAPLIRVAGAAEDAATERQSVLVGYGPDSEPKSRRARGAGAKNSAALSDSGIGGEGLARTENAPGRPTAVPAARKLARELEIDLAAVSGTGPEGAVTVEDVRRASGARVEAENLPIHISPPVPTMRPENGMARSTPAERETRTPVSGIRKRTAATMTISARDIPQASAFVTTDFTGSMELLDHLRSTSAFAGLSLTPLALIAKATLVALNEFPELNAVWDEANQEIVTKHYVNLGIAVATQRGLLVPNLKEAQTLSLRDLCREISRLAETARGGTAALPELTGGTFTISNVGVFGVDTGVALVNPGEAAILCLGSIRKKPWVHRDELAVRWVTTLGLSFDHRLIDGEQAARFLASVATLVEDPLTLLGRV